jgi:hypothetical protein
MGRHSTWLGVVIDASVETGSCRCCVAEKIVNGSGNPRKEGLDLENQKGTAD